MELFSPLENILLVGFMGSGKSSVGRRIADQLGRRFVDTDQLIEEDSGAKISDIFKNLGESHFRDQEHLALESLRNETGLVIATGGGIVTRPENIALLRELGFVVWLAADEKTIFARVSRNTRRPLLQTQDPRETITTLLAQRRPLYEAAAHFTIDTSAHPHDAIANAIIAEAQRYFEAERVKRT